MRKTIAVILLTAMLMLTACGRPAPGAVPQGEGAVQNPKSGSDIPASGTQQSAHLPSLEVQRQILEANRVLWAFDEGEYAPDWYYTFTDLDHNGLLELLSASTQGSGMFTYAHFYEVLPDGSGVKNLYHADAEIEGPDDWPEVILSSIPCWYDRAADRYYYVCSNVVRDGAAHGMTQVAALCLKDGVADWEYLASMDVQRTEAGEQISYTDGAGNPISEQDYNSAVARRFAGMEQTDQKLDWIAVRPTAAESALSGTWQTASVVSEQDGTAHPAWYVQFKDAEILYGRMEDGAFVVDHADPISRFEKTAAGGYKVQAQAANGVQYTFQTSESDPDVLEYFETWDEAAFPESYRGGASLSRCG